MHRQISSPGLKQKLLTSCILSLALAIMPVAQATYDPKGQTPPSSEPSGSGTTRGGSCRDTEGASLTLFAPQTHIGETTSSHPTFVWFIPDSEAFEMKILLFEDSPEGEQEWGKPISLETKPGIMHYSLPQDQPGLVPGKTYMWEVVILCDPDKRSNNVTASGKIKVVPKPPSLEREGVTASDYAKEGFWYDALGEALKSAQGSQLGELSTTLLKDLAEVEEERICSVLPENIADLKEETTCSTFLEELANLQEKSICLSLLEESGQIQEDQIERKCELIDDWGWLNTWRWINNLQQITALPDLW